MAKIILKIDTSELQDVLNYLEKETSGWPMHKRQSLCDDLMSVLRNGTDLVLEENGTASLHANAKVFDVLNRYGLSPVC